MCKLFMIANAEKLTRGEYVRVIMRGSSLLTERSNQDGFGWAALGKSGQVFGEKYMGNRNLKFPLLFNEAFPKKYKRIVKSAPVMTFGEAEKSLGGALIMHSRQSTNEVSLRNSHPHRTSDFTLIHNGRVDFSGEKYEMQSTCDSEHLVHSLSKGGIDGMVENCPGWYAVGALEHKTGNFYLIKDDHTSLHVVYSNTLESLVFSTSRVDLEQMCTDMKWKYGSVNEVDGGNAFVFNPKGELIEDKKIQARTATYTSYSKKSQATLDWERENIKSAMDSAKAFDSGGKKEIAVSGEVPAEVKKPALPPVVEAHSCSLAPSQNAQASGRATTGQAQETLITGTLSSEKTKITTDTCTSNTCSTTTGQTNEISDAEYQELMDAETEHLRMRNLITKHLDGGTVNEGELQRAYAAESKYLDILNDWFQVIDMQGEAISVEDLYDLPEVDQVKCAIYNKKTGVGVDPVQFLDGSV